MNEPYLRRAEWLTQLGPKFWNRPKPGQTDISLFVGRLPLETMLYIVGGPGRRQRKRDAVRYARVSCLLDEGFHLVEDDDLVNGGRHVRVQVQGIWSDEQSRRFDSCFEDPEGGR